MQKIFQQLAEHYRPGIDSDDLVQRFEDEIDFLNSSNKSDFDASFLNLFVDKLSDRRKLFEQTAPNGQIDAKFKQGNTGDCWLIASIIAINNSDKGKKILNDSIKVNDDGTISVYLKGVKKSYTFTRKEIEANTDLSSGDLDVRAIELAVEKYFYQQRGITSVNGRRHTDLNANCASTAYQILLGKCYAEPVYTFSQDKMRESIKRYNDENNVAIVSAGKKHGAVYAKKADNESLIKLEDNHAYAVVKTDENFVYLINPWDSSAEIKVDIDTFLSFFSKCESVNLDDSLEDIVNHAKDNLREHEKMKQEFEKTKLDLEKSKFEQEKTKQELEKMKLDFEKNIDKPDIKQTVLMLRDTIASVEQAILSQDKAIQTNEQTISEIDEVIKAIKQIIEDNTQ